MARTPPPAQSPPQPRRSAFTLIEMVVVIGIIGVLMAMGIPGIVSQIKRADLYNTTNIISALHSFCVENARADLSASPNYTLEITATTVTVKRLGATFPSYEIGKQFAYAVVGADTVSSVNLEDNLEPVGPYPVIITYENKTGFVTSPKTVTIRDKKTSKETFAIKFWATGVINVNSAP